jgi:O-antigen ligase
MHKVVSPIAMKSAMTASPSLRLNHRGNRSRLVPGRVGPVTQARPFPAAITSTDQERDLLLMAVMGYILTAVGRVHQLFSSLEAIRPVVLTGLVAILMYVFDGDGNRQARRLLVPTTKCLLAFLGWMILSVPTALVIGNSFDLAINSFIKTAIMFIVVAGAVRGHRDVERLALAYLVAATVYGLVVLARFDVGDAAGNWRLGRLYYYDANDFATFAVTAMPFGLYFVHAGRRARTRRFALVSLGVLMLAFLRCGSRGGLLALAAVVGFVLTRYRAIPLRQRVVAAVLVSLVTVGAASSRYWTELGSIGSSTDYNLTQDSGRLQIWQRGIGYMLTHPLLGVGANNFSTAEGRLSPFAGRAEFGLPVKWSAAHNSFIQVGAELGIPGLLLFLTMLASAFTALRAITRRARSSTNGEGALSQPLTASLLGFVVGGFFLSLAYSEMLYTLLAFGVALQKINTDRPGL